MWFFFFQAEDGIRDLVRSRGLGDVYKRQLLLSASILVPCLRHEGATVWDTLAIAEYLNEVMPLSLIHI